MKNLDEASYIFDKDISQSILEMSERPILKRFLKDLGCQTGYFFSTHC
jgi:hypothetical protein